MSAPRVVIDRDRLVDTASRMVGVHSFTGDEQGMAELMRDLYDDMGLRCQWQQVEDGRANALSLGIQGDMRLFGRKSASRRGQGSGN